MNEPVSSVLQVVQTVGFPIAVCLICFWYIYRMQTSHEEQITKMQQEHKEETEKLTSALNNNTIVMQKLVDKIGASDIKLEAVSTKE